VQYASMSGSGEPTWRMVLAAAERLDAAAGEFRLQDLVAEVQHMDPARRRESIQPVVQGMTANAGGGPPSPCGKPLLRVSHGLYKITTSPAIMSPGPPALTAAPAARGSLPGGQVHRAAEIASRLSDVSAGFAACIEAYDRQVPFRRSGQYETHRATIDARQRCGSALQALEDDVFLGLLYETLQRWGIGRRGSRLVRLQEFRQRLQDQAAAITKLETARIDDPALDIPAACDHIWQIIESLRIVSNISLIVPGTKALHHVLPDLVPPMDRAWTGAFFLWSAAAPQNAQAATFTRTFTGLTQVARSAKPAAFIGDGWRTSRTKVLDNAIIGYCKLHAIAPHRT
jgi:hypothetical protein